MSQFTQQVILGLLLGGVYVAVALGFSLVWGILNIVNLAHGALVIVGSYITWALFSHWHLDQSESQSAGDRGTDPAQPAEDDHHKGL